MSSPRKPQSSGAAQHTPGEASSFRQQSVVSASVKPLQLRGGQSPVSPASSASHTPRQPYGPARRLSAEADDSPTPTPISAGSAGRPSGRRLSNHSSKSRSPYKEKGAVSPSSSSTFTAGTPIAALYNPSIRSPSHPHPIRLRVPKNEEREELSPESDPGTTAGASPSSAAEGWSGRLRVPITSRPTSAAVPSNKNSVDVLPPPPVAGVVELDDLPTPGASLIEEALAARGLPSSSPAAPTIATPVRVVRPTAATETPQTQRSDSVEVSRLTAFTHTQDEDEEDGESDANGAGAVAAKQSLYPRRDVVDAEHEPAERTPNASLDVSATSLARTPSPSVEKAHVRACAVPSPASSGASSPKASSASMEGERTKKDNDDEEEGEWVAPTAIAPAARKHQEVQESTSAWAPSASGGGTHSAQRPQETSSDPGKPPLAQTVGSHGDDHCMNSHNSRPQPPRSRSGGSSSTLLVSPSRSPDKEQEQEGEEETTEHDIDTHAPASHTVGAALNSPKQPSPRLDSDGASYISEELKRTLSPPAEDLEVVASPATEGRQDGHSDGEHTATPARARAKEHGHRPSSASSSSSGSSRSPRLQPMAVVHQPTLGQTPTCDKKKDSTHDGGEHIVNTARAETQPEEATSTDPRRVTAAGERRPPTPSASFDDADLRSMTSHDSGDVPASSTHRAAPSTASDPPRTQQNGEDTSLMAITTAELRTPREAADASGVSAREVGDLGTHPSLLASSSSRTRSPVAAHDDRADLDDTDQVMDEKTITPPEGAEAPTPRESAVTTSVDELTAASASDEPAGTSKGAKDLGEDTSACPSVNRSPTEELIEEQRPQPPHFEPAARTTLPMTADLFDEDEIESVPDYEMQTGPPHDPRTIDVNVPQVVTASSPSRDKRGDEIEDDEARMRDTASENGADDATSQEVSHARSDRVDPAPRTSSEVSSHHRVDLAAEEDESDDSDEAVGGPRADGERERAVISSIAHSDDDDAPTYPSAMSEDKTTHPAARTLFATCISGSPASSEDDAGDDCEDTRTQRHAGEQERNDGDSEGANENAVQVHTRTLPIASPHSVNDASDKDDHHRSQTPDPALEEEEKGQGDGVDASVAAAPPVPPPTTRATFRFALTTSSSSSASSTRSVDAADPREDDTQGGENNAGETLVDGALALHECAEEEGEKARSDADHNSSGSAMKNVLHAPRARSSSPASSVASSSSSRSLFRPNEVTPAEGIEREPADMSTLAQTTAIVELPADMDDDRDSADENVDDAETRSVPVDAPSDKNSIEGVSAPEARDVCGGVRAPEAKQASALTPPHTSEQDSEDDAASPPAPAHPFSAAGRRAQHNTSLISARGAYEGTTPSRLPPESLLFDTAHSIGPSPDGRDDHADDGEGEEPARDAPLRTPQSTSMAARRQQVLQGYLDDVAAMEVDDRSRLMRDYVDAWRACVEEEAVARGALPQQIAASKLVITTTSSCSSASSSVSSASRKREEASHPGKTPASAFSAAGPRGSVVRRFSHISSSSDTASESSSSAALENMCHAMDRIQQEVTTLATGISEVLADEDLYRRYVEEQETSARSGLSRLVRTACYAWERDARAGLKTSSVDSAHSTSSAVVAPARDWEDCTSHKATSPCESSVVESAVGDEEAQAVYRMHPSVLIAKEPLVRAEIATAEVDERLRLTRSRLVGIASLVRLRDLSPRSSAIELGPQEIAEQEEFMSQESMEREEVRVREVRDRVLLCEYQHHRLPGRSPSFAAGAAARLRASLSIAEADSEEGPVFFEWDPTTNTSAQRTSADDTQHHQSQSSSTGHGSTSHANKSGEGRARDGRKSPGGRIGNKQRGHVETSTSSPSPRVHSSLLLTSSDPSHEEAEQNGPATSADQPDKKTGRSGDSSGGSGSTRRSPTVVPSAQTEAASLLRAMHNAQKAHITGVRHSYPRRDAAHSHQHPQHGTAATSGASPSEETPQDTYHAPSPHSPHSPHAAKEQARQHSLRSRSRSASGSAAAVGADAAAHTKLSTSDAQTAAARPRRRSSPRLPTRSTLLTRHSVPCSYCRPGSGRAAPYDSHAGGEAGKSLAAPATAGGDANARYHALLRRYGQETKEGRSVRSGSSSARTPPSPSRRPYSDDTVFNTPPHSEKRGPRDGGDACDLENTVQYYTLHTSPKSEWSVEAHHGSPSGRRPSMLPNVDVGAMSVRHVNARAEEENGTYEDEAPIDAPSLSEDEETHAHLRHVFRVLYPPEETLLHDVDSQTRHEASEPSLGRFEVSRDDGAPPPFIEVIRQGPVIEPSAVPPAGRQGLHPHATERARSGTRRPASAERRQDLPESELHRDAYVVTRLPHYTTPTRLSITRAQDVQLLQAIREVRGRADGAKNTTAAVGSDRPRVRCSKQWSSVRSPSRDRDADTAPVLITRLPLEAGPGVWMMTPTARDPHGEGRPTVTNRLTTITTPQPTVCVATVDSAQTAASRSQHRAPSRQKNGPRHHTRGDAHVHGARLDGATPRGSSRAAEAATTTQTDERASMTRAFRDWAEKGGVGVVHLPPSLSRELPVPMRCSISPPPPPPPPPASSTFTPVAATRCTRTRTPPSASATKYSYVDRFYKQSPEQIARTVDGVRHIVSPAVRDWGHATETLSSSAASSHVSAGAGNALLWPPEASRLYGAGHNAMDVQDNVMDTEVGERADPHAYVHHYWQQRRAQREVGALRPRPQKRQHTSHIDYFAQREREGLVWEPSSHAYVGRHGQTHAYA